MSNQFRKGIEELVKEARSGDKDAENRLFAKLHARFLNLTKRRIYRANVSMLEIEKDAEDIVQDALATIVEKYENEAEEELFIPWSFQVLRYKIGNYYKRNRRSKTVSIDTDADEKPIKDFSVENFKNSVEYDDLVKRLRDTLSKMDSDCKKILTIFLEGGSRKDIIDLFRGVPLGTIDNKVYRCRQKLKSMLRGQGVLW